MYYGVADQTQRWNNYYTLRKPPSNPVLVVLECLGRNRMLQKPLPRIVVANGLLQPYRVTAYGPIGTVQSRIKQKHVLLLTFRNRWPFVRGQMWP